MDEEKTGYSKEAMFERAAEVAAESKHQRAQAQAALNASSPKTAGGKKPRKKMKRTTVYGIVAVVAVVGAAAGAGMWHWHEQPSFCSTMCHIEDEYVSNYMQEQGTTGIDKYHNQVSNTNAMMAVLHRQNDTTAKPEIVCVDCHVPNFVELANDGVHYALGDYYVPRDERTLDRMKSWDGEPGETFCANANCHAYLLGEDGELDREKLAKVTASLEFNPHDTYHEGMQMQCSTCHKGHRASVYACTSCHEPSEVEMPDGWLTWDESQALMSKEFGGKS